MASEDEKYSPEQISLNTSDNLQESIFEDNLKVLSAEFDNSMLALINQNVAGAEEALFKAKNIYKGVSLKITDDRNVVFKILVNYIEVLVRVLRSNFLIFDERYKKSLEELEQASKVCDEVSADFDKLDNLDEELSEELINYFKSYFLFFNCIVSSSKESVKGSVSAVEGKFVDEIEILRESVKKLRKFNDYTFGINAHTIITPLASILDNFADISERKIERLEERRRKIQFLPPIDKKVFIIHGHDEARLKELKEILRSSFNLEPIILNEMPDNGDTIIEKFEEYARFCAFAFVLFTKDDWVKNKENKYFQARPNVLFELGWFCGRFGRDKVRILKQKGTEMPSDLDGIVTIEFYEKLEEAFRKIGVDLENNGLIEKGH